MYINKKVKVCLLKTRFLWFEQVSNSNFVALFQYAVMHQDGTPLVGIRRQVTVQRIERGVTGYTKTYPEDKLIVRDDGIVQYDFIPDKNAQLVTLRVSLFNPFPQFCLSFL